MKSKNQYLNELTSETTNELIDIQIALFTSLDDEDYEQAAKLRDKSNLFIGNAALMFSAMTTLSSAEFELHFKKQCDYIQTKLINKYGKL